MSVSTALTALASAATIAAEALTSLPASEPTVTDDRPRLPNGKLVYEHCRTLYTNPIACWQSDSVLADTDQVELNALEDIYLVHWPGSDMCAVVFPTSPTHDRWRMQEFKADKTIENFMRSQNAWREYDEEGYRVTVEVVPNCGVHKTRHKRK
ncbi:MAG: hypothetical protein JSS66_06060 [Armatimonadetes bacterium]|nr:hypothetical protein [Armatimonadota bacterium]